ncbi:hypothetical protein PRIPAC_73270 [Pristionchus pacificus]|uniref:Uncharacterized protein n=1 Tax=Pristionchus pacificus TaxID=54126 RepID=A0A2A6C0K4_PRIPA|nr:hypothetical protein PRIPAC_73270 [Pristionchus pacificus]|eukprot:PDM71782.1 hypothetical protein PRIPAC_38189 [Pristionchus pacificus]
MSKTALIFLILGLFVSSVDCCPYARHKKRDVSDIRSKLTIYAANLTLMTTKIRFTLKDNDVEKTWSNYINTFDEVCPLTHVQEQYVHLCFKKLAVLKNIALPNVVTFPDAARHRDNILEVELLNDEDTILFSFLIHTFEE